MSKLHKRTIETGQLLLQPYTLKYADALFRLIQENKLRLLHSFPKLLSATETPEATRDYVQQKIFDWNRNRAFGFLVLRKEDGALIGHFNIKDLDWKARQGELAYFIDASMEGKGLMSEAIQCMLKLCFEELQLERVVARIVTSNASSIKLAERAGLRYEGTFYRDYTTYDRQIVDTYRYGISREEFLKR